MQIGISPKVKLPAAALLGLGVALLVLGVIIKDDITRTIGLSLVGASGVTGGVGYAANPGEVVTDQGPASDDHLSAEAQAELSKAQQ